MHDSLLLVEVTVNTINPPSLAEQTLTVVENPSVLEIAMSRGHPGALACTSGHLAASTMRCCSCPSIAVSGSAMRATWTGTDCSSPNTRAIYGAEIIVMHVETVQARWTRAATQYLALLQHVQRQVALARIRDVGQIRTTTALSLRAIAVELGVTTNAIAQANAERLGRPRRRRPPAPPVG